MVRVLIVDDSLFMRKTLKRMIEEEKDIEVVGLAENGRVALEKIEELKPDVVTLDIEMPVMDGIETLKRIMSKNPCPVIIVSALTKEGADITLEALSLGASDFITKDFSNFSLSLRQKKEELVTKIRNVAKKKALFLLKSIRSEKVELKKRGRTSFDILAIGASTGGPAAIQHLITNLPQDFPSPIVIAQHMPKIFTLSFAERLSKLSFLSVKEAEDGEMIRPSTVFIAPGGIHMRLKKKGREIVTELFEDPSIIYKPSVNRLFISCAEIFLERSLAVILSGMGNDGLEGARVLKSKGGIIIAQDEETCVVYGMPKAVVNENLADLVLPIYEIPKAITRMYEG